ncbi:uncharacterized protein JCM10292_003852 [Rhodotorula paludigena]|uniref:uncharacterized protein n=1 Tax=Rhodotorula paludigena TaxID=86838 RepID=UPI00318230E7
MDPAYLKDVLAAVVDLCNERDLLAETPFAFPPPVVVPDDPLHSDDGNAFIYRSEAELTGVLKLIYGSRIATFCRRLLGKPVLFAQPTGDDAAVPDLEICPVDVPVPRITLKVKLDTVLDKDGFAVFVSTIEDADRLTWVWPESESVSMPNAKVKVTGEWGFYKAGSRLREDASSKWSAKHDDILLQVYVQLIESKIAAVEVLAPHQINRMLAVLTNGSEWLILGEQDGVALIPPFVLESKQHGISAILAALLIATVDSSELVNQEGGSEPAEAGGPGSGPPTKRPKLETKPVLRALENDAVPRPHKRPPARPDAVAVPLEAPAPISRVAFKDVRQASVVRFAVREDLEYEPRIFMRTSFSDDLRTRQADVHSLPEVRFDRLFRLRNAQPVVYRSLDKRFILKVVYQYTIVGKPLFDDYFVDDSHEPLQELLAEAAAFEYLESAVAANHSSTSSASTSATTTLFPRFVGYFRSTSARETAHAICTANCGLPIEQFDLPFLNSLEPQRALERLHGLGVAHGDIHRSSLRVVGAAPPPASAAASNSPRLKPAQPSIAFIDFGRAVLRDQVSPGNWVGAKKEDRLALEQTLKLLSKA